MTAELTPPAPDTLQEDARGCVVDRRRRQPEAGGRLRANGADAPRILEAVWRRLAGALEVLALVAAALIAWQAATDWTGLLPARLFPPPATVLAQIAADSDKIIAGIGSSLAIVGEGFLIGSTAGVALGLGLSLSARTSRLAAKAAAFLSAIPPVVYIPYGIALLPTFRDSSILVIFLASFWPVLTGTLAGVESVDRRLIDAARVLGARPQASLLHVVLPGALPLIFNGMNIGLCLSFILLTSAEMIGGSSGMGYYVKYYSDFSDYPRILAGIIVIGVVVTIISTLMGRAQAWLLRWR